MRVAGAGVDLHVAVDGREDAPPLLMLHGITASHTTWDWLLPDLVDDWRVHRLDFRGHGESGRAAGRYMPSDFIADSVAVLEQIGEPTVVIGHSLGGLAAAGLIRDRPALLRGVVMEDPALTRGGENPANEMLRTLFTIIHKVVPRVQASGIDEATLTENLKQTDHLDGRPVTEVFHDQAFATWASAQLRLDVGVLEPVINGASADESVPSVADVVLPSELPGLLIAPDPASPDTIIGPGHIEVLATASPALRCEVVPGASHNLHDDLAGREPMRELIRAFLADLG